jgi:putative Mg2+ transporter-C (MgtC) family protein
MNFGMHRITWEAIALRLALAFCAGALLGWERQSHGRAAGLRTTILACVSSTLAMVLSDLMFQESSAVTTTAVWRPDPARMAQGILTGIGFLGAGTILREGPNIRGVTTAATLWFSTVLGLCFGSGHLVPGLAGIAIALITLHVLPQFEGGISVDWYSCVKVRARLEGIELKELKQELEKLGLTVKTMKFAIDLERKEKTITCDVRLTKKERFEAASEAVAFLSKRPGVLAVSWE